MSMYDEFSKITVKWLAFVANNTVNGTEYWDHLISISIAYANILRIGKTYEHTKSTLLNRHRNTTKKSKKKKKKRENEMKKKNLCWFIVFGQSIWCSVVYLDCVARFGRRPIWLTVLIDSLHWIVPHAKSNLLVLFGFLVRSFFFQFFYCWRCWSWRFWFAFQNP